MANNLFTNPLNFDTAATNAYYDLSGSIGSVLFGGNADTDTTILLYNMKNIARNAMMEKWGSGAAAAPDQWVIAGASATVATDATKIMSGFPYRNIYGASTAALTRAGADCKLSQSMMAGLSAPMNAIAYWKGRTIISGCWVWASVADRAYIETYDGQTTTTSAAHAGGSGWTWLPTAAVAVHASATELTMRLIVKTGDTTAYFVGAMFGEARPLINMLSTGNAQAISYPRPLPFDGLYLATLTGGNLLVQV